MATVPVTGDPVPKPGVPEGFGKTRRTDTWWHEWLKVLLGLGFLGIYAFFAAEQGKDFEWGSYLSPFYSPSFLQIHNAPRFMPISIIALASIILFRGTCYYYRKAYYRSFFSDPPGCAVSESRKSYCGETAFPWLVQNSHRYFMYLAMFFLFILWVDMVKAFIWGAPGDRHFEIHLGSLIMLANVILLSGYSFGCHSLRHLLGGSTNCFSCELGKFKIWSKLTKLNMKHQQWAWASLISVCATDLYIRLLAAGVLPQGRWM